MKRHDDVDVVIVGGGPVGSALAIDLAQRGHDSILLERYETPQIIPKGQNLTQRTLENFRFWGVENEIRAARPTDRGVGNGGLVAYGKLIDGLCHPTGMRDSVGAFYVCANDRLPQYLTEDVLRRRISEMPTISARYGSVAEAVRQEEDGVVVTVRDPDGTRSEVRGRFAVGCDGSRSLVREAAGITRTRSDHARKMVLMVFRAPALEEAISHLPMRAFYRIMQPGLDGYWRFLGRVDRDGTWFYHAPVPKDTTAESLDAEAELAAAVGIKTPLAVSHIGFWSLRIEIADSYRAGRVFIAGDAAHSHPPYGGFGVNTGFEDARNLGWKLAAALDGWAGPELLDSYGDERRPVFVSVAHDFIEAGIAADRAFLKRIESLSPDEAARAIEERGPETAGSTANYQPHYSGSPICCGPSGGKSGAVAEHIHAARPGYHLGPAKDASGSIHDRLGPDFTLLATDKAQTAGFDQAARKLGVPLRIERIGPKAAEQLGSSLILVRPDHYVAWTDASGADADRVVRCAIGHMFSSFPKFLADRNETIAPS